MGRADAKRLASAGDHALLPINQNGLDRRGAEIDAEIQDASRLTRDVDRHNGYSLPRRHSPISNRLSRHPPIATGTGADYAAFGSFNSDSVSSRRTIRAGDRRSGLH